MKLSDVPSFDIWLKQLGACPSGVGGARDCGQAMTARDTRAAVYLAETADALVKKIGGWGEGETEAGHGSQQSTIR